MQSDEYLTTEQAGDYYGLSVRAMEARRSRGDGPPYVRLSRTCVRYRRSDLERYAKERTFLSTAEEAQVEAGG
jgi:hypothetical protein